MHHTDYFLLDGIPTKIVGTGATRRVFRLSAATGHLSSADMLLARLSDPAPDPGRTRLTEDEFIRAVQAERALRVRRASEGVDLYAYVDVLMDRAASEQRALSEAEEWDVESARRCGHLPFESPSGGGGAAADDRSRGARVTPDQRGRATAERHDEELRRAHELFGDQPPLPGPDGDTDT